MNKLLKMELAVLLMLVLVSACIRVSVLGAAGENEAPIEPDSIQSNSSTPPQTTDVPTAPPTEPSDPTSPEVPTEAEPAFTDGLNLTSRDYFIYDCSTDTLLACSGNLDKRLYPASITKLFTAYVALQHLDPDRVLTLGQEVNIVPSDSSLAYLKKGQKISVAYLVEAMMLRSGADAAYALAVAAARECSGDASMGIQASLRYFVNMMNETAAEQGMTGTHFVNPDGYHDSDHYTTSRDLIKIGQLALDNDLIRQYAATLQERLTYSNGDYAVWNNTNDLIDPTSEYFHADAIGLKTGHTASAGFCLLSAFEGAQGYVLVGSFGCQHPEDRYVDTLALYMRYLEQNTQ